MKKRKIVEVRKGEKDGEEGNKKKRRTGNERNK